MAHCKRARKFSTMLRFVYLGTQLWKYDRHRYASPKDRLDVWDGIMINVFTCARVGEYFPLTSREASKFFTRPQGKAKSSRKLLELARPPSIVSLPGRYCVGTIRGAGLWARRLRLYDRRAVVQSLAGSGVPQLDKTTTEPKRFMAIISAPVLLHAGRQVDHGFFCLGCWDETDEKTKHFRIKYTTEEMSGHIASYGQLERVPMTYRRFRHVTEDQVTP